MKVWISVTYVISPMTFTPGDILQANSKNLKQSNDQGVHFCTALSVLVPLHP